MERKKLYEDLRQAASRNDSHAFSKLISDYLIVNPPLLAHSGVSRDCFNLLSPWIDQYHAININPFHLFKGIIDWSLAQYLTLSAQVWYLHGEVAKASHCCKVSLRMQQSYLPAHRLLRTIQGLPVRSNSGWICPRPFLSLDLQLKTARVCCNTWLPYSIGDPRYQKAADLWDGPAINEIRNSVINGSYQYCNPNHCPHLAADLAGSGEQTINYRQTPSLKGFAEPSMLPKTDAPKYLQLSYDPSCNLRCPTCRSSTINASAEQQEVFDALYDRSVKPFLQSGTIYLSVTFSGDPFASLHYRQILHKLNSIDHPNLKLCLYTNALLLRPEIWDQFQNLWPIVSKISVSVDAASAETYAKVRPPGSWHVLIQNLRSLSEWRELHGYTDSINLTLNFCVQRNNYLEMLDFVELGASMNFDEIYFQRLMDWGTMTDSEFIANNICSSNHPLHNELNKILKHKYFQNPQSSPIRIRMGVLSSIY